MWDGVIVGGGVSALGGWLMLEAGSLMQIVLGSSSLLLGMLMLTLSARLLLIRRQ
jgi:hypothetical protein